MASEKQISANRRNATMSTGPITFNGKARSAQNAVTHGLTAERFIFSGEDAAEFERLRQDMLRHFSPIDAVEEHLVERAARLMWRLRRVPGLETLLFEARKQTVLEVRTLRRDGRDEDVATMGRVVELLLDADFLLKLSRYESGLQKQLVMTLKEIREMRASRAVTEVTTR
jgi:hypothetical protein